MALIDTDENELDRKLHRIVLEAHSAPFGNLLELARRVHEQSFVEFSYVRDDETRYLKPPSIRRYAAFARVLNLLDEDRKPTQAPSVFGSLGNFQNWLGNKVVQYLNDNKCSSDRLKDAIRDLLRHPQKPKLPTPDNLLQQLDKPIPRDFFQYSIRLLLILRPKLGLELRSRRMILHAEVVIS